MPEPSLTPVPIERLPLPRAIQTEVVSVPVGEGLEMRTYCSTEQAGRPMVLLHSINAAPSAMEIKPLFKHYAEQRPVYAPDLPGFGQSTRGDFAYSPEFFARCLTEFLVQLPGDAPDIVVLSLTSEFVARAIVEQGARCNTLTMISPTGVSRRPPPGPEKLKPLRAIFDAPILGSGLFGGLTSSLSIRYFLDKAFVGNTPTELVDYAKRTAKVEDAKWAPFAFLGMGLFTHKALDDLYAQLEIPTLVLYDQDPNVDLDHLPLLLERNAHVTAERLLPSLGLPHWETPAATFAAIDRFLNDADQLG